MQSIARGSRGRLVQPTLLSGTASGMVAIGMDVAIGIGGTVDGGPIGVGPCWGVVPGGWVWVGY